MDLGLKGKQAIVCASSRGLGKACAVALAREGCDVVINGRDAAIVSATADEIARDSGVKATPVVADVGSAEGRAKLLAACTDPDILINNNGGPPPRDFRAIGRDDFVAGVEGNMITPIALIQAVIDGMAERGYGRIVNIATVAAKFPTVPRLLSGPARSALANYVTAVSKAIAKDGVIINNLLPGMFLTETLETRLRADAEAKGVAYEAERDRFVGRFRVPAGRFGDPAEAGEWVAMLCSRQAAYVVGQNLVIDGGLINGLF
jgi:3-oxoacyl-[acyl-carrier protein] reductase